MSDQKLNIELKDIIPEYYSHYKIVRWLFKRRLNSALDFITRIKPNRFIDIGCGDGSFVRLINEKMINEKKMDIELYGIDINPNVIHLSQQIGNCKFSVQDLKKTDFPNSTFDAVVCLDTLEHIQHLEPALVEFKRILKNRGYLITSEPVESVLYKSLRFLIKGTWSQETGPGAGVHYSNARGIDKAVRKMGFARIASRKIPFYFPFDLFHINLYRQIA